MDWYNCPARWQTPKARDGRWRSSATPRVAHKNASWSRSGTAPSGHVSSRALTSEGFVAEVESVFEGLARLADESFDVAIVDLPADDLEATPDRRPSRDPLAASRELRPFTDLVLISDGDPIRCGEAFAREVAAILPRPLPEVDALLRAHINRLVGFRRSRTRGLLVLNAYGGVKDELDVTAPELAADAGGAGARVAARSGTGRPRRRRAGRGGGTAPGRSSSRRGGRAAPAR